MNKTISEGIVLTRIIYYLETVIILHIVFNVNVCAQGSPQYFDALDGEHIGSKIMHNALKAWVVQQKKMSLLEYVPDCGALSQEHCFAQVKIKIAIEFKKWLRCCDELQSLGKPSYYIILYYITIMSEGQTTKGSEHSKNTPPKVKCNMAKIHEFRWIAL